MAFATGNFSFIGWFFIPRIVTYFIQTVYYVAVTPLGEAKPAKNSSRFKRDKARIFGTIIALYLLFTVADDFYSVLNDAKNPNSSVNSLYSILEMKTPIPGSDPLESSQSQLRSNFRKLSRKYHPDKIQAQASAAQREGAGKSTAGTASWLTSWRTKANNVDNENDYLNWTPEQIDRHFIKVKAAYDVLSNPATRYGYERFGTPALKWAGKDTFSEDEEGAQDKNTAPVGSILGLMFTGIKSTCIGFYAGTFAVIIIMYTLNYPKTGHGWRFFIITSGLIIELFVLTRPLGMVYSSFPFMKWIGLMPYQFVTILHKLMITTLVAINQLGPLLNEDPEDDEVGGNKKKLSESQKKAAKAAALAGVPGTGISGGGIIPPLSSHRGQSLLEKQLEFLEQLTDSITHEATQAYRHQMLPFLSVGGGECVKKVQEATVQALVDRQVLNDLEVKDAIETHKNSMTADHKPQVIENIENDAPALPTSLKHKTGKPVKTSVGIGGRRTLPRNKFSS